MESPGRKLVILDWDSTLFDLLGFVAALPHAAELAFGIEWQQFAEEIPAFYAKTSSGDPIGYDSDAHFAKYDLKLTAPDTMQRLVEAILMSHRLRSGRDNLLFADAAPAVAGFQKAPHTDLAILTVNVERSLELKRRLTGDILAGIPIQAIPTNKGRWLAEKWQEAIVYDGGHYSQALVIDDSPEQIEAVPDKPGVTRLQIVRPNQKYPANKSGIPIIKALTEAL